MSDICITNIVTATDKVLVKDADGYRDIILGALNVYNTRGDFYKYTAKAARLLADGSELFARISSGLFSEEDHPPFARGMTTRDFIVRNLRIEKTEICATIKDIRVVKTDMYDRGCSEPIYLIYGKVKPTGPYGPALESDFNNPSNNVAFSIRSFTIDTDLIGAPGKKVKELDEIITWDRVPRPGIYLANKFATLNLSVESSDMMTITPDMIKNENLIADMSALSAVSTESDKVVIDSLVSTMRSCVDGGCLLKHWS